MSSSFKTGRERGGERRREGERSGKKTELQNKAELNEAQMELKAGKKKEEKKKKRTEGRAGGWRKKRNKIRFKESIPAEKGGSLQALACCNYLAQWAGAPGLDP